MNNKIRIALLGATGMAGHMAYQYLSCLGKYDIIDFTYKGKISERSIELDLMDYINSRSVLTDIRPDIILNCTGKLISESNKNPDTAIFINSFIPHFLARISRETGGRLIHLSTDCVFSGKHGNYTPDALKDATEIYGMSKSLGEVVNGRDLTIRTSIIGPELKTNGEGLLHWFLRQKGSVEGYTESLWSGVTTLELAKFIDTAISHKITGLFQLTNGGKISKFELLSIFRQVWNRSDLEIRKVSGKRTDKSLLPSNGDIAAAIPDYHTMCSDLKRFMNEHSHLYCHYQ